MSMTRARSCRSAAVAVSLACLLAATRGPSAGGHHSPFVEAVARNWEAWDVNHDGTLSGAEIERAVLNPAVKGDDAAAAAALEMVARNPKKYTLPPLTKAYFEQYDAHASNTRVSGEDAATATVDLDKSAPGSTPKWDLLFAASKHRIQTADAAPTSKVSSSTSGSELLSHMRQGPLGDCFFVAVVGSAINRNPADVGSLLKPMGGGKYDVAFANGAPPFVLPSLTDAERAISSSTGGQGDWLAMLEQAYGRYRHMLHPSAADAPTAAAASAGATIEGTDTICHGGNPAPVITALTGHAPKWFPLPHDAAKRAAESNRLLPELRTQLVQGVRDRKLMVATVGAAATPTPGEGKTGDTRPTDGEDPTDKPTSASLPSPPGISHGHCYAVVGYDPSSDIITIWNPHGETFTPKGEPGLSNGYPTSHGIFKLPLTQAYQFYSSFYFETPNKPAAAAGHSKPG
jgi:hypothetical protein